MGQLASGVLCSPKPCGAARAAVRAKIRNQLLQRPRLMPELFVQEQRQHLRRGGIRTAIGQPCDRRSDRLEPGTRRTRQTGLGAGGPRGSRRGSKPSNSKLQSAVISQYEGPRREVDTRGVVKGSLRFSSSQPQRDVYVQLAPLAESQSHHGRYMPRLLRRSRLHYSHSPGYLHFLSAGPVQTSDPRPASGTRQQPPISIVSAPNIPEALPARSPPSCEPESKRSHCFFNPASASYYPLLPHTRYSTKGKQRIERQTSWVHGICPVWGLKCVWGEWSYFTSSCHASPSWASCASFLPHRRACWLVQG